MLIQTTNTLFAEKHYVKAMLGFNQELTKYNTTTATRQNLISQDLPSMSLGTGMQTVSESGYEWALRGGFFRLNYIYNNRYLFEVNGRYDGTSRFPSDNRFCIPAFILGSMACFGRSFHGIYPFLVG